MNPFSKGARRMEITARITVTECAFKIHSPESLPGLPDSTCRAGPIQANWYVS